MNSIGYKSPIDRVNRLLSLSMYTIMGLALVILTLSFLGTGTCRTATIRGKQTLGSNSRYFLSDGSAYYSDSSAPIGAMVCVPY